MGTDVFGRNPESEAGFCFRASSWEWAAIYEAMLALGGGLVDRVTLLAMNHVEGAGPVDGFVCRELAKRFDEWLARPDFEDRMVAAMVRVPATQTFDGDFHWELAAENCAVLAECRLRDLVERWVRFLRHCGGFSVM